ncbi:autotransporter outer membrane beta-barrel domain-containing protein [Rickettsia endosymbiont of Urophora cardui]|uniref:autotransporter outer membrane beta-barrel domain-containing protein n=1 Tax=Rickettsia endosymbiont of Urophora cardui TaxID=3066265 RepID=UPI00313BC2F2
MQQSHNKLGDTASLKGNFYSLYGLYTPSDQNIFISTIGIYGISDIKSSAKRPDSQIATSNHKAYSNIMQVMFGYNYKPISSLSIKPIFGIKYSKIRDASYREYGAGAYNLALSGTKSLELETITGLKLSNSSVHASSISITPEMHCFLHKNIKSKNPNITAKFLDEGALLSSGPINRSKLVLSYGAGLNVAAKNLEIGLFYNGNKARKYMSHAGSIKLKINI